VEFIAGLEKKLGFLKKVFLEKVFKGFKGLFRF